MKKIGMLSIIALILIVAICHGPFKQDDDFSLPPPIAISHLCDSMQTAYDAQLKLGVLMIDTAKRLKASPNKKAFKAYMVKMDSMAVIINASYRQCNMLNQAIRAYKNNNNANGSL